MTAPAPHHSTTSGLQHSVLQDVAPRFAVEGAFLAAAPFGRGHIHDTFLARFGVGGREERLILQRLNDRVFADPLKVLDNMARVTRHLQARLAATPGANPAREALDLVPARDGQPGVRDADGRWWRAYRFVEGVTHEACAGPEQAREAAKVVGRFQRLLSDLPPPRLHETIPFFHHTPRRLEALEAAAASADPGRRRAAKREIAFALARRDLASLIVGPLEAGEIAERVVHNDTKLNNVVFDEKTGSGLCLVDLDTCMPGSVLYDFGDMVRSMTCEAEEDTTDLSRVRMDPARFEAIVQGYLEAAGGFLARREIDLFPVAGQVMTYTIGIRFLTDHLSGDTYFKVQRHGQNLDRCRVQFALVESMEQQQGEMVRTVKRLSAGVVE